MLQDTSRPNKAPRDLAKEVAAATAVSKEFEGAIAAVVDRVAAAMSLRVIKLGEDYLAASKIAAEVPALDNKSDSLINAMERVKGARQVALYKKLTGCVKVAVPDAFKEVLETYGINEASLRQCLLGSLADRSKAAAWCRPIRSSAPRVVEALRRKINEMCEDERSKEEAFWIAGRHCISKDDQFTINYHMDRQKKALDWLDLDPSQRPAYSEVPGEQNLGEKSSGKAKKGATITVLLLALKKKLADSSA